MANKQIHVTRTNSGTWKAIRPGNERASAIADTQKEAIDKAREIAKNNGLELVIHGEGGKIRDSISYGNDPCPPVDEN